MKHIAIVLGYGIFIKPNDAYQQRYLEPVLNQIINQNPDLIITCGGASHKDYPNLSEAQTIKDLFISLHPELESKIITEDKSLSTPENLGFSASTIATNYPESDTVTIYCDSCRVPKVFYLALSLFLKNKPRDEKEKLEILSQIYLQKLFDFSGPVEINFQNITVIGVPLSDNMSMIAQQITSSMLDMHAFDYPDLHKEFVEFRKKKIWGLKY